MENGRGRCRIDAPLSPYFQQKTPHSVRGDGVTSSVSVDFDWDVKETRGCERPIPLPSGEGSRTLQTFESGESRSRFNPFVGQPASYAH